MDKSQLISQSVPEGTVDIPGVGEIRIRGLSRYELLLAGKIDDTLLMERKLLSMAMLDPKMTEKDVEAWQKASPAGQIAPVVAEVNRLSGVSRQAEKEAYKRLRDEPDA